VVEHRQLGEGGRGLLGGLLSIDDPRAFYEAGYTKTDAAEAERLGRWRALGARSKAAHVRELCARTRLRPRTIVEIGCGDGALLAALRGLAPVFDGFELSAPAAQLARRALPDARRIEAFDGSEVPAEDDAYDLAILSHVLEHVPVPLPLLAEAARVAHEVLVEVPLEDNRSARRPGKREEAASIGHLHFFSRATVRGLIAEAGLEVQAELTDPLSRAHHAFFADGLAARSRAAAKWAARAGLHRVMPRTAETLFTVHYAVLARRP
jgi:SAM-dependent methyltransferase